MRGRKLIWARLSTWKTPSESARPSMSYTASSFGGTSARSSRRP